MIHIHKREEKKVRALLLAEGRNAIAHAAVLRKQIRKVLDDSSTGEIYKLDKLVSIFRLANRKLFQDNWKMIHDDDGHAGYSLHLYRCYCTRLFMEVEIEFNNDFIFWAFYSIYHDKMETEFFKDGLRFAAMQERMFNRFTRRQHDIEFIEGAQLQYYKALRRLGGCEHNDFETLGIGHTSSVLA